MQSINIELGYDTVQKIHEVTPFVKTDEDMHWVTDWVIIFGLACISQALVRNPEMTLADIIYLTTQNLDDTMN